MARNNFRGLLSGPRTFSIDPHPDWNYLFSAISDYPDRRSDLFDYFTGSIFSHLDMEGWIGHILSGIDCGSVITFGGIARTLGDARAARAVGEIISSHMIHGPIQRVVYSDGTIPKHSIEALSSEVDTVVKGGMTHLTDDTVPIEFTISESPLGSLRTMQDLTLALVSRSNRGSGESLAGIDISSKGGNHSLAISVHDLHGEQLDSMCMVGDPGLPYIPGYLFFREGPMILPGITKAEGSGIIDDRTILVLDGNGSLHPRKMGIATQIGVVTDHMSIGVSKKLMIGTVGAHEHTVDEMSLSPVVHKGSTLGYSLSIDGRKPIFISPGHAMDLDSSVTTIIRVTRTRIPEPTKWAHRLSNEFRKKYSDE